MRIDLHDRDVLKARRDPAHGRVRDRMIAAERQRPVAALDDLPNGALDQCPRFSRRRQSEIACIINYVCRQDLDPGFAPTIRRWRMKCFTNLRWRKGGASEKRRAGVVPQADQCRTSARGRHFAETSRIALAAGGRGKAAGSLHFRHANTRHHRLRRRDDS